MASKALSAAKKFSPLYNRVLVQRAAAMTKTVSGVILPESAQSKLNEGVVVRAGPGARGRDGSIIPLAVKEGDRVLLPEYGGSKVKFEDEEFTLIRDDEVLGVIVN